MTASELFYERALHLLESTRFLQAANNTLQEVAISQLTQIGNYLLYILIVIVFLTISREWFR